MKGFFAFLGVVFVILIGYFVWQGFKEETGVVSGYATTSLYKANSESMNIVGEKLEDNKTLEYGESYALVFTFNFTLTDALNDDELIQIYIDLKDFNDLASNKKLIEENLIGLRQDKDNNGYFILLTVKQANAIEEKEVYLFIKTKTEFVNQGVRQINTYVSSSKYDVKLDKGTIYHDDDTNEYTVFTHDLVSIKGNYKFNINQDIITIANSLTFDIEINLPVDVGNLKIEFYDDNSMLTIRFGNPVQFLQKDYAEDFNKGVLKMSLKNVIINNNIKTEEEFNQLVNSTAGFVFYLKITF